MNHLDDWSDEDVEIEIDNEQEQEEEYEETESEGDPDELDYDVHIEGDESEYIDECAVNVSHFDLLKKLGSGAYGNVFLVKKNCGHDIDKLYALKVINKVKVVEVPKSIIHMKAERKALEILRHCPYIQKLFYSFQSADKLFLVTEYIPGGELFTLIQKQPLLEHYVVFYIAELVVALEHIHLQGIVYRDIKLENVMLDADGHIKLVDFGLCKKLGARGRSKSFCGTEEYMAPEVVACTGHNTAADWWALGVLAIELLSTVTPFGNNDGNNSIMDNITNREPENMPENITKEMHDLLMRFLEKDPTTRLGGSEAFATKVKQHPIFRDIDWKKLENRKMPSPYKPTLDSPLDVQNFSEDFTTQIPTLEFSEEVPNSFLIFKGYSYIAPELSSTISHADCSIDENWNTLSRSILSDRDPNSEFYRKYQFESDQPLGNGKSSVCMKCFRLSDNTNYAVKVYKRQDENDGEIGVLSKAADAKTPGIPTLFEVLRDSKCTYLIMELVDGVNLLKYFSSIAMNMNILSLAFNELWKMVKQLHQLGYAHRSICFKNICYLKKDKEFRLIGFSNAKPITGEEDEQIDYWSLGVCIYTVLFGRSPFNSSTSIVTNGIENIDFDQDSEGRKALRKGTQYFIDHLLRSSNSNPTCSKGELKKLKQSFKPVINYSEEQINENKNIVGKRATKVEIRLIIKTELNTELNGTETMTNGNDSLKFDEDAPVESQTNHNELNGHVVGKKRSKGPDGPNKKLKTDNPVQLKPHEIKEERDLRIKPRIDYAIKSNIKLSRPKPPVKHRKNKATIIEVKDDIDSSREITNAPKSNTTETTIRRKGRPKKVQSEAATSQQTVPQAPIIPKQHSSAPKRPRKQPVNTIRETVRSSSKLESPTRTFTDRAVQTYLPSWRPERVKPVPIYCFLRFDYK